MKTKKVDWSYPSSSNAVRFGFARTGCYTVSTMNGLKPPKAVAAFATEQEALEFVKRMPEPWIWYSRHARDVGFDSETKTPQPIKAP